MVHLENIGHRFAGPWLFRHVSLHWQQPCCVLLTGANGAGKSTLLRLLATALSPIQGRLSLLGKEVTWANLFTLRQHIAFLSHHSQLYSALSGLENLQWTARLHGYDRSQTMCQALLDNVGLLEAANQPLALYSAGMKRRLALARLLLGQPRIVLLDEPLVQLDSQGVAWVRRMIQQLKRAGCWLCISSHEQHHLLDLCDEHVALTPHTSLSAPKIG